MKILYIHPGQTASAPDSCITAKFPGASFQTAGGFSFSPAKLLKLRKSSKPGFDAVVVKSTPPLNYFKELLLSLFFLGFPAGEKYIRIEGEDSIIPVKPFRLIPLILMFLPVVFLSACVAAAALVYTCAASVGVSFVKNRKFQSVMPTEKSLVFLCPSLQLLETFRGSTSHVKGTLSGFVKSGWKPVIISPGKMDGVEGEYRIIPPLFRNLLTGGIVDMLFDMVFTFRAMGIIKKIKPAFIYQRHGRYCISGVIISAFLGIPLVLEMNALLGWESGRWSNTGGLLRFFISLYEKICLSGAYRFSAISGKLREDIIAAGAVPEKVFINPNGADAQKFRPGCGGDEIRRETGIENRVAAGFSGSFYPWHGVDFLADAIIKTIPANSQLVFILIGEGPELAPLVKKLFDAGISVKPIRNALKELFSRNEDSEVGKNPSVFVTGKIPPGEVPAFLDACDILLSPIGKGKEYSSPIKIFEYMAAGKAILCFEGGQMNDVFVNGKDALMTAIDESAPFARALEKLAADEKLRSELGKNAREKMLKQYTWQANAQRITGSLYQESPTR
ncbi:MAG: glycosyltransferase [Firmicutes bacterium]|nr:glycosyltransferase [Bacillota bacterium]